MTTRYVAAIDQGTTSTRCLLFDREGRMVSVAQRQHRQSYPRPGWVEHDAEEIWRITRELVPQALQDAGVGPEQVVGLGVTNQRETTVVWDRATGRPVAPAIVWQDTRTAGGLAGLVDHLDFAEVTRRTGLPVSSYPSGPKLRWILDSDPAIRERAERGELLFGTMDTWLVWKLSGGLHVTDATNASRTLLMDLETLAWDPELLEAMRVPASMLPEIRPSIGVLGVTRDPVPGIPISAVIGDQQASLFGQTAFERGQAKCTFGTGSFLLMNTGTEVVRSRSGLITTVAHTVEGEPTTYALEGSVAQAGALVEWCRTSLDLIRTPAEIETLAATVADNGGCYVVPAFSGLYAPYWESQAQGVVVGLTSYVTKGHLARAVLEATAWQARDVVDAMIRDAQLPMTWLAVDGGMTADNLLMQTVADVLDVPVIRPMMAESVALGAAYAAGLAVGYWPDRQVLRAHWHRAAEWHSRITAERRDAELAAWHHAVSLAIAWGRGPVPGARGVPGAPGAAGAEDGQRPAAPPAGSPTSRSPSSERR
ncbi:glycerol kinase GlpK [Nocardioides panaciterrulae]|uniref:glycerol kinase n=1 Tax=Nocardioides panaciterrulae TaxID=661492 RepID=A0A7Y9E890_9ACTN|nr:glycerol kinase [Nocardioides panaciterrulae]